MKAINYICGIIILIIVSGCGVPQDDYDKLNLEKNRLLTENQRLITELNEYRYGAEKIVAEVEKAYKERNYVFARQNIKLLREKHPESPKNMEFKTLLKEMEGEESAISKLLEAKEKERTRLANKKESRDKWYQGGTLHNSIIGEWYQSSYEDKLATCSDWVVSLTDKEQHGLLFSNNMKELRSLAEKMEKCVTEGNVEKGEILFPAMKSSESAITCWMLIQH